MPSIMEILGNISNSKQNELADWFKTALGNNRQFFYTSVDIRHAGYKIAPVDTNLFPAGFNTLSDVARSHAVTYIAQYFADYYKGASNVLLVPEEHTRNLYYLENVYVLSSLLKQSGLNVRLGSFANLDTPLNLTTANGNNITVEAVARKNNLLYVADFKADVILLNNDLTSGTPSLLQGIEQPILPPPSMGWHTRRKSVHFDAYDTLTESFAKAFDFDPWLISTVFFKCGKINFKERSGLDCAASGIAKVIEKINEKYKQHGISETPYVFIKADFGTYGMGIMTAKSADEFLEMNKKIRNKMSTIKGGAENSEVIIQEGVPTVDSVDGKSAEALMYLIGNQSLGCHYRVNSERDRYGNLNAEGMYFSDSLDVKLENKTHSCPVRDIIARLAALASIYECYCVEKEAADCMPSQISRSSAVS